MSQLGARLSQAGPERSEPSQAVLRCLQLLYSTTHIFDLNQVTLQLCFLEDDQAIYFIVAIEKLLILFKLQLDLTKSDGYKRIFCEVGLTVTGVIHIYGKWVNTYVYTHRSHCSFIPHWLKDWRQAARLWVWAYRFMRYTSSISDIPDILDIPDISYHISDDVSDSKLNKSRSLREGGETGILMWPLPDYDNTMVTLLKLSPSTRCYQ